MQKILQVFERLSKEVNNIHTRLKPPKTGRNSRDLEDEYTKNAILRKGLDQIRTYIEEEVKSLL